LQHDGSRHAIRARAWQIFWGRAQKENNLYFRMAHKKGAGHLLGDHMAKEHGFIDAQRHGRALDRGERTIAMPHLMWRVRPGDSLAGR